jgi:uncharacterized protein (TIGR02147 family)
MRPNLMRHNIFINSEPLVFIFCKDLPTNPCKIKPMAKTVFDYVDYRAYFKSLFQEKPHQGYGQLAKIARAISVNPSILTLVLKGEKDFTPEQANDLTEYFQLTDLEAEYFLNLVALSRASKPNLRARVSRKLKELQAKSMEVKSRIPPQAELSEESKAIFYSSWYFSAVRLLTSIEGFNSLEIISERLGLPRGTVKQVLEFLVSTGLCIEKKNRKFTMGPQSTHLGADSLLVSRHHQNWRLKAIERSQRVPHQIPSERELFFTSPVSISKKAIPEVRKVLVSSLEDCFKIIDPAPCEELACLNIDWFEIK